MINIPFVHKLRNILFLCILFALSACGDECVTVQDYMHQGTTCPFCSIFKIITTAGASIADASWGAFATSLQGVIVVAAAVKIAWTVLTNIGSFKTISTADLLTGDKQGILITLVKAIVIIELLRDTWFLSNIVYPVLSGGLEIGITLAGGAGLPTQGISSSLSGYSGIFDNLMTALESFNREFYKNIAIGNALMCVSSRGGIGDWVWMSLLFGFIFFIFGWLVLLGLSFYFIDILIRLAIGATLLPLGIAAAFSSYTSEYAKNIWNVFMNIFANFLLIGLVVGLSVNMIAKASSTEAVFEKLQSPEISETQAGEHQGEEDAYQGLVDNNEVQKLADEMFSFGLLVNLVICFGIVIQLYLNIGKLASTISDTESGSLGDAGNKLGAQAAKTAQNKIAKPVGKLALNVGKESGNFALRVTRADEFGRWSGNKLSQAKGFLTGTGDHYYNFMLNDRRRNAIRRAVGRVRSWF